jgi:glycosyltransferase involved in cell wall biosynthesis
MTRSTSGPRVCFITTGLARNGAETQLFHAACGLRSYGFDVHVVSILSSDYYGARLVEQGVPLTCLDASRTTHPVRILSRFVRYAKDLGPVAVVGFNYPGSMLARAGGALARIPIVISSIRTENLGSSWRKLALGWTDSLATVTTTNSHMVARKLVDTRAASRGRVRVIPNGLDLKAVGPHLRSERAAIRESLGVREDDFLWLAAGRFEEPKDYPNLLAAVALLAKSSAPLKLAIAGAGPLQDAVRNQVAALGLGHAVSLLGQRDDVTACMAAADATVLASAWESSPNVVIESLAVGTPVVCTDVGGVREIVLHGGSGLIVQPRDPVALAGAMSTLMDCSENARRQMGAVGRKHIEDNFALDRFLGSWSGLLNQLVTEQDRA